MLACGSRVAFHPHALLDQYKDDPWFGACIGDCIFGQLCIVMDQSSWSSSYQKVTFSATVHAY
jgi:hypothetical protein